MFRCANKSVYLCGMCVFVCVCVCVNVFKLVYDIVYTGGVFV